MRLQPRPHATSNIPAPLTTEHPARVSWHVLLFSPGEITWLCKAPATGWSVPLSLLAVMPVHCPYHCTFHLNQLAPTYKTEIAEMVRKSLCLPIKLSRPAKVANYEEITDCGRRKTKVRRQKPEFI